MEKVGIEKLNNHSEMRPGTITLDSIPNAAMLEQRFENALAIPHQAAERINALGGDIETLSEKLKPLKKKLKGAMENIRSHAKAFTIAIGTTLFATGLITSDETHHSIESSNKDPRIKKERAGAYAQGKSEWLAEHIQPFGYTIAGVDKIVIDNMLKKSGPVEHCQDRYDAWYLYLGLEQEYGTFTVSPYQPGKSENKDAVYYRMEKMEDFLLKKGLAELGKSGKDKMQLKDLHTKADKDADTDHTLPPEYSGVMARYTISKGSDEKGSYISYYDKWDLQPGGLFGKKEVSDMVGAGKPFEIYGRIYYDPQTGKRIER